MCFFTLYVNNQVICLVIFSFSEQLKTGYDGSDKRYKADQQDGSYDNFFLTCKRCLEI